MLPFTSDKTEKYKSRIYRIASQSKVLLFKVGDDLYYRSGLFVSVSPIQIPSLYSFVDLFLSPSKLTVEIHFLKISDLDAYIISLFLDTDLSDCPRKDYNPFLKSSLKFHKQQLDLLRKNLAIKDYESKFMSKNQVMDLSVGVITKSAKKYAYPIEFKKEKDIFRKAVFNNNKIKKIDYKRDSIIPESMIVLGKTISNKDIGVNSHVLFLTGQKSFRRLIIQTLVDYFTKKDNYHVVIVDFGLNLSMDKTFFRQFAFDDILFDPFSFKDKIPTSQYAIFISHITFISKNILKLNDRQIGILEEKLAYYLQQETNYSWHSFLNFVQDEITEESLVNPLNIGSFTDDAASSDFTSSLKAVESPLKSNDFESLLNKLRYLDYLFAEADRTSLSDIFFKNHLDIFALSTTPDLKSLAFYLLNLFYSLNDTKYKQFIFFFLEIDSILFDKFNDIDVSWIHPDLKNSLFDSTEIYSVKKIFNLLDTRIYASYITNAPYSLLPNSTKDNIDKLQYLHDYCLLESPTLQRQEYFKIISADEEVAIELPTLEIFEILTKLLFSRFPEFSFDELFVYFDITRSILSKLLKANYLHKKSRKYILTDKSLELKKGIVDYLAYQPPLTLEENELIIKYSDSVAYNVIFNTSFPMDCNIESLCTRFLSTQFINAKNIDGYLLYYFLAFKTHLINEEKFFYFFLVAIQSKELDSENEHNKPITDIIDSRRDDDKKISDIQLEEANVQPSKSKIEIMQGYLSNIKNVLDEDPDLANEKNSSELTSNNAIIEDKYPEHIQIIVDRINKRINDSLPGKGITFPKYPIFLIMKFLDSDIQELIHADITELVNTSAN